MTAPLTPSGSDNTPPIAPMRAFERTHHGVTASDPYDWMKDRRDPELIAYLEAENAYAAARTAHLAPLREQLFTEIKGRVQESDLSVPVGDGPWWYYSRTIEGQQYAIHARSPRVKGEPRPDIEAGRTLPGEQILLDGNQAAAGHEFFAVGALTVSADHRYLAAAIDLEGDERFAVTVTEIESGHVVDAAIAGAGYGLQFDASGRYLFHIALDDAWRPHQVWRHEIGTLADRDVLVYQEDDERFWMGIGGSRDDRFLMIGVGSKTTSETWLLPADDPLGAWRCVAPRREGIEYDIEVDGDRLLIVHNTHNPEADLAAAPLTSTDPADWVPVLASGPGERFLDIDTFEAYAVLSLRAQGLPTLRVLPRDPGSPTGFGDPIDWPAGGDLNTVALAENPELDAPVLTVVEESFVVPRSTYDVDPLTGARALVKRQPVLGGYDPGDYVESREWVRAGDGTAIPVSVVRRADVVADGTAPALLTGYGAYEIPNDPYFSVARLSLLDRGLVYVVAHVRGGGEMGRGWYDDGKLERKRNTFTDFVAVADAVRGRWADPARLACEGGSAGGLLIGAVLNLAPDRFRFAHAKVPFVDALTSMLDPDLPLTVGEWEEWGNPLGDAAAYEVMASYAPYDNVGRTDYPAILATTSLHDTRVLVTEPAKWIAKLRTHATNDSTTRPILLHTEMSAGHGGRSGRYDAWHEIAWDWAVLLDQLGVG
ncbi:S9 family peptidase [Nostocoides jenkinsii]|uniref:Protease II n=1 Tax=Nostocoides jenkinsii Ben 74 TaxID=1193518 RepID=A0A077MEP9_9MICO|nr:S9 family peptidase [Tetrasphaera jenkinsii]CCI53488.1 Protease II [Tetrasphaera jenkinsii Ben 74]